MLLIAALLLRDRRAGSFASLSAMLTLGAAADAICGAPGFQAAGTWWHAPLIGLAWGNQAIFWLWACAAFGNGDFLLRRWHAVLWLGMVGCGLAFSYGNAEVVLVTAVLGRLLSTVTTGLTLLVALHTVVTWGDGIIAGRRRLRVVVLIGALAYIAARSSSAGHISALPHAPSLHSLSEALILCCLAATASWYLFGIASGRVARPAEALTAIPAPALPLLADPAAAIAPPLRKPFVDSALQHRLEQLMTVERAYREEGLTVAKMAEKLSLPEYRLRQLINEELGYRNFSAFLNSYRLTEVKQALADPSQRSVPVLTIAMDAGFQSLGPFNRAFKMATGTTPSEFRQTALQSAAQLPGQ